MSLVCKKLKKYTYVFCPVPRGLGFFFALNRIKNAPLFLAKLAMVTYHERLPSTKVAQEYPNH